MRAHRLSDRAHDLLMAASWAAGLAAVAVADPASEGLLSVCPFDALGAWLGLEFCPGCGLGHAVGYLVRGQFEESLAAHPLAVPAVGILIVHVAGLVRPHLPRR